MPAATAEAQQQSNYETTATYSKNANYVSACTRASLIFPFVSDPFTRYARFAKRYE